MKRQASFTCDCKVETEFNYDVPGTFQRSAELIKCKSCGSLYTIVFRKDFKGDVRFTLSLSKPSRKLSDYLENQERLKRTNAPQKKAPLFVMPSLSRKV